jgi:hypothetical protein
MKSTKPILTAIIAGAVAIAAQAGFAQPSGSITNVFTGPTNVLWDFSTVTNPLQNVNIKIHKVSNGQTNTQVEIQYAAPITQDGRGKLSGAGTNEVTLTTEDDQGNPTNTTFAGKYISKGSVNGTKGVAHLAFTTSVKGNADLKGATRRVAASANYNVKFDAVKDVVTGRVAQHASASGLGAVSETRSFSDTLSSNTNLTSQLGDGSWTLVLNFNAATNTTSHLSGSASVALNFVTQRPLETEHEGRRQCQRVDPPGDAELEQCSNSSGRTCFRPDGEY